MKSGRLRSPDRRTRFRIGLWLIFGFGLLLRLIPNRFDSGRLWDEKFYIADLLHLLQGQPLLNDHPPLGKALLALGYLGGGITGSRLVAMLAGALLPVLAAILAERISGSQRAGWLAALLLCCETYLLAESRYAVLNPLLCLGILLTLFSLEVCSPRRRAPISGLLWGFTLGIKWIAAPLLPLLLWRQRSDWRQPLLVMACGFLAYQLACTPAVRPEQWAGYQQKLLNYHQSIGRTSAILKEEARLAREKQISTSGLRVTERLLRASPYGRFLQWTGQHSASDQYLGTRPAWLWPLGGVQLYAWSVPGRPTIALAAISNPLIWLGSLVGGGYQLLRPTYRWIGLGWGLCWFPWLLLGQRPLYPYTYEPALLLGLLGLALLLDQLMRCSSAWRLGVLSYLSLAGGFLFLYLPFSLGFGWLP